MMPVDGSRHDSRGCKALGLRHTVVHAFRSIRTRVLAWRAPHRQVTLPDAVVIGTLRRPTLAIAIQAAVVPTKTAPPPMREFLTRLMAHPLSPYYPRGSLPLEPWQADHRARGSRSATSVVPVARRFGGPPPMCGIR
jgi:hypothetical protein